jgi:hypothetical protein
MSLYEKNSSANEPPYSFLSEIRKKLRDEGVKIFLFPGGEEITASMAPSNYGKEIHAQ